MNIILATDKIAVQAFRNGNGIELVINAGQAGYYTLYLNPKQNEAISRVTKQIDDTLQCGQEQESIPIGMI